MLLPLVAIFGYVVYRGVGAINWAFLTQTPKPVGEAGGECRARGLRHGRCACSPRNMRRLLVLAVVLVATTPLWMALLESVRPRILIDSDPGSTQFWAEEAGIEEVAEGVSPAFNDQEIADICANICYRFYRDDRKDIRAYTLLWRRIMCKGGAEIHVITVDERSLHKGDLSELVGVLDVDEYKRLGEEKDKAVNAEREYE